MMRERIRAIWENQTTDGIGARKTENKLGLEQAELRTKRSRGLTAAQVLTGRRQTKWIGTTQIHRIGLRLTTMTV